MRLRIRPGTTDGFRHGNRPRILISLDRSWINWLGLSWFTYSRLIRNEGGLSNRVLYRMGPEEDQIQQIASEMIEAHDGLLLSGGSDVDPELYGGSVHSTHVDKRRDQFETQLIREARIRRMPILGICRGCQLLNVAFGGTLHTFRDQTDRVRYHGGFRKHEVILEATSRMAQIAGSPRINQVRSLHGQAVDTVASPMRIVGRAIDGVAETIESQDEGQWAFGVQWHPELMWDDREERPLIQSFVQEALHYRNRVNR